MSEYNLTVVIPAYNSEAMVPDAIRSAWEVGAARVLVVDDASSDSTVEVARSQGADVLIQPANAGAAAARRTGVAATDSEFIILLDADDALLSAGVVEALEILRAEPDVGIVYMPFSVEGVSVRAWPEGLSLETLISRGHAPGPPASFVWRRETLERVVDPRWPGLWPRFAEDYELLIRGSRIARIAGVTGTGVAYQHEGGKSHKDPMGSIRSAERIRLEYADQFGLRTRPRSQFALWAMTLRRRYTSGPPLLRWCAMLMSVVAEPRMLRRRCVTSTEFSEKHFHPSDMGTLVEVMRADWNANPKDPRSRLILSGLRISQYALNRLPTPIGKLVVLAYRFVTEVGMGTEIRPKTRVGPGLTIYHGFGLVINDAAIIGANVTLRNGVVIGNARADSAVPWIGDSVVVGANACIIGGVRVGDGAVVGAGAVVVKDVRPATVVAGNPAVFIRMAKESDRS